MNVMKSLLCLIAVAGFGLSALPREASATVLKAGVLLATDPHCPHRRGCHEYTHSVRLVAGVRYKIALVSDTIDTVLYLEDSTGRVVAMYDNGALNNDSLIEFNPTYTGTYRVVVTSNLPADTGSYLLAVTP